MEEVYLQLNRYLLPIVITFGTFGAISNEFLFYFRKLLRTTSCSLYFRALSANDLIVIWYVLFNQWLAQQFDLNPTTNYIWYCKFSTYLTYVSYTLSPYFIVLACFDRLCTSSTNARLRKIATIRIASILIPCVVVLISLIYTFVPWKSGLISFPFEAYCGMTDRDSGKLLAVSLLLVFCLIPPFLMIILCTTTFILLRQQRHRIMPINQARLRHRDNQLLKMLFIYVTSNIVCIFPFTVTYFLQIYYYNNYSPLNNQLVQIFSLLVAFTYGTSFYVYTLGTPFYRDELCNLLKDIWQRIHRHGNAINDQQQRRKRNTTGT